MDKKIRNVVKTIDNRSFLWRNDREYNNRAVLYALKYCHELLKVQGYLFLNQVYRKLGLPLTKEEQTYGWVYDKMYENDILWIVWHENDEEVDVHITFEPLENILDTFPSEEEL